MSFVKVKLDDTESVLVAEGEYDVRILNFKDTVSKNGNAMTMVLIRVEDPAIENAELIRHYLTYPDDNTPADQERLRRADIKRLLTCFGVPHEGDGFNKDDLLGATARCLVVQENGTDGNVYNRLRLPWLKRKGT